MIPYIEKSIAIQAPPSAVWETLTDRERMQQWMAEPEMELEVITDWKVGNPIAMRGFHHIKFENKGTVLQFEPYHLLKYDYLSSISRLPDKPENRTVIGFRLEPVNDHTVLHLALSNFPADSIFKHVDFYWGTTLEILKSTIEQRPLAKAAVEKQ